MCATSVLPLFADTRIQKKHTYTKYMYRFRSHAAALSLEAQCLVTLFRTTFICSTRIFDPDSVYFASSPLNPTGHAKR